MATVWEVIVDYENRELGWMRKNCGLFADYEDAMAEMDSRVEEFSQTGMKYDARVVGRKVNEK